DLLSGEVQVMFDLMPASIGYIRTGKLRALAVTTSMPSEALPDLPTVNKFLVGYEASTWNGVAVPRNTSTEIIDTLNGEINAGLADPNITARLTDLGATALTQSSADFGKLIADETEKWRKVIRAANIKAQQTGQRAVRYSIRSRAANIKPGRCKRTAVSEVVTCIEYGSPIWILPHISSLSRPLSSAFSNKKALRSNLSITRTKVLSSCARGSWTLSPGL